MKSRRHMAIREILATKHITTQEELCQALKDRGFNITQATVSRDIKELCLIKISDGDGYHYAFPDARFPKNSYERMQRMFRDSVASLDYSENIIVIKTLPGAAQSIGSVVDSLHDKHILGSVAGDDTIFIIVKPKESVVEVVEFFRELVTE